MATAKAKTETETKAKKMPTHRVAFRKNERKGKDGTTYREPNVELGAAWANEAGGISFPMMGGWVTVWPIEAKEESA